MVYIKNDKVVIRRNLVKHMLNFNTTEIAWRKSKQE